MMTKNIALYKKPLCKTSFDEVFDVSCPGTELISEEKRPSLYSLSLSESICSDSSMGFNMKEPACCEHATPSQNIVNNEEQYQRTCETKDHIEGGLIATDGSVGNKFRKCMSLYDVSNIIPSQMAPKSVNTVSSETIHSQSLSSTTKSKDSGFHRSVSCISLPSGKRNYDHIESKVKAYIRNIKETEALKKKNKIIQKCEIINNPELPIVCNEGEIIMDKEDLLIKIQELKHELHEKSLYIDVQQKNYNRLLLKFAEAKNTIDTLRLQRISLDYSSLNESQNISSTSNIKNLTFDDFVQEINKKAKHKEEAVNNFSNVESNGFTETCSKQKEIASTTTSKDMLLGHFRPSKHSTPDKSKTCKCLSPVSKLFSSSSRLDKQCDPLVNIYKHSTINGALSKSYGTINKPAEPFKHSGKKSKLSSVIGLINKKKLFDKKHKKESTPKEINHSQYIDLPNDDPFDKVKKWQASLPNINLVGIQSSSDLEDLQMEKDGEINSLLSQELVTKCKISEMEVISPQDHRRTRERLCQNDNMKSVSYIDDNTSDIVRLKTNSQLKSVKTIKNLCLSHKIEDLPSHQLLSKSKASVHGLEKNISESDNESQSYNPRSSSISHRGQTVLKNNMSDDSTDCSSSISSSDLGSSQCLASTKSKRRHMQNKCNSLNKIPKFRPEKPVSSKFVLRESRLNNVKIPNERCSLDHNKSQDINTSSEQFNSSNLNLKTESSQRKAWNARNKANFYVLQDFYYKDSSSLLNCITTMEGMVTKSFPIFDNVLERSICK